MEVESLENSFLMLLTSFELYISPDLPKFLVKQTAESAFCQERLVLMDDLRPRSCQSRLFHLTMSTIQ